MNVTIAKNALRFLRRLFRKGRADGVEVHAYALGTRTEDGMRIEHFVSAGKPRASGAMIEPDYGASAKAITPYLEQGKSLLGEAHSHLDLVGPSRGDLRTLASVSDQYPGYACMVIAPGKSDPIITFHTIENGTPTAHNVISEEYQLLDPSVPASRDAIMFGWGSGGAAVTPGLLKLGFRTITVADNDAVEARNLERHLATKTDVGKPKVDAFKRFARGRTRSQVRTISAAVTSDTRDLFTREIEQHDIILNATGHPVASRTISHLAQQKGKPVVHAAVGERGSLGFVFLELPGSACFSCLFPLDLSAEADDAETLRALTEQYGLTEDELSAQLGLWTDVSMIASLHTKILLEYLKGRTTPNLYLIDNEQLTITQHAIARRTDCICQGGNQ